MSGSAVNDRTCLHLVAGGGRDALKDCLSQCAPGDALCFLAGGVLQLLQMPPGLAGGEVGVYFLAADLQARGLLAAARRRNARVVDDSGFCDLLAAHRQCLTWT